MLSLFRGASSSAIRIRNAQLSSSHIWVATRNISISTSSTESLEISPTGASSATIPGPAPSFRVSARLLNHLPDARFEVAGTPASLLSVSLSPSQYLYTRRGTLVGLAGKAENVRELLLPTFCRPFTMTDAQMARRSPRSPSSNPSRAYSFAYPSSIKRYPRPRR